MGVSMTEWKQMVKDLFVDNLKGLHKPGKFGENAITYMDYCNHPVLFCSDVWLLSLF